MLFANEPNLLLSTDEIRNCRISAGMSRLMYVCFSGGWIYTEDQTRRTYFRNYNNPRKNLAFHFKMHVKRKDAACRSKAISPSIRSVSVHEFIFHLNLNISWPWLTTCKYSGKKDEINLDDKIILTYPKPDVKYFHINEMILLNFPETDLKYLNNLLS